MKRPAKKGAKTAKKATPKAPAKKAAAKATPKPRAAKTSDKPKADPQAAENSRAVSGSNLASLSTDQKRAIFLNHVNMLDAAKRAEAKAKKRVSDVKAMIKSEGGNVKLTEQGIRLMATDERGIEKIRSEEVKIRAEIEATLKVAEYVGSDLGQGQIDWLEGLQPAGDRAFDEGKMAGLQAGPRKPPYDPSVTQYRRWMEGFDEGQAVLKSKFAKGASKKEDPTQTNLIFEEIDAKPAKAKAPEPEPEPAKEAATGAKKSGSKAGSKAKNKGQGSAEKNPAGTDGGLAPENEPSEPAGAAISAPKPPEDPETGPELDAKPPTRTEPPAPPDDEPGQTELQMGGEPVQEGATKH